MDSGLYAACAGLKARVQHLDLVGNNLAKRKHDWLSLTAANVQFFAGYAQRSHSHGTEPGRQ